MKILLYSEGQKLFGKSGVGKALEHQKMALKSAGVDYTSDENEDYDLAHINTIGTRSSKVLKKTQKKGKPAIYHTHTTYEDFKNSFVLSNLLAPLIKKRVRYLYSRADYLISPSEYTKKLVERYLVKTPAAVVSNGVDTKKFSPNGELAASFREHFNIETPLVISVGLPFERKGVVDFCDLALKRPGWRFIWFGAKLTPLLPGRIKKLIQNPPANVSFPGFIEESLLLGAYSAADAFLFPSYEENEGIVVLEALAMKCPLIVRDIGVYKNWLISDHNCLKANDNFGFIESAERLMTRQTEREKIVSNGRKTAKKRDIRKVGTRLRAIYEQVLSSGETD